MTKVVQLVALDVPHCTLTYSVVPCRAQAGFDVAGGSPTDGVQPNAVYWGDAYATRGAGLTGAADSQSATGSFWYQVSVINIDHTIFSGTTTVGGTTTRFRVRFVNGVFRITGSSSAGTSILDIRNATAITSTGSWYHVQFSFNLGNAAQRHLYVDDVSDLSVVTYTNATIDYTLADWSFGALPNGGNSSDSASYADFWLQLGTYVDLSNSTNRRKFISANGNPVYLGTIGQAPGFGNPIIYFGNAGTDFKTNLGTGLGFTVQNSGGQEGFDFASGTRKCFNSLGTCQDLENFSEETVTLYFSEDAPNAFISLNDSPPSTVYPFIKSVDFQPAIVSLEGQIGQRASLKVVFRDAPHPDNTTKFDKYPSSRTYDPYMQGTFWGKFRARNPYMRGRQIRLYIGESGQALASLETRYFLIDSMDGPNTDGEFTITAQDILKLASGDRVVAPRPSDGYLTNDILTGNVTISISPSGALAAGEYATTALGCLGGNELVFYTNIAGDNVDLVDRGDFNTEEKTHSANDRFQVVLWFDADDPAAVLSALLSEWGNIWEGYISDVDWTAESAAYLGINISLVITEPTPVDKLVEEILEATGSAMWWDDVNGQIRWQVIRSIPTTADRFTEDQVLLDTLEITEQPEKRVSKVIVYFGQINPTLKVDETSNYRSMEVVTDDLSEFLEGSSAIKIIYARAIAAGGRSVANRIATRYLGRFVRAPRRFKFELLRFSVTAPTLGGGYLLGGGTVQQSSWPFQDDTGARAEVPIQITRVSSTPDRWIVEAEEMLADATNDQIDTTVRNIVFDTSQNNINLKDTHDSLFFEAVSGDTINCTIGSGVTIGSNSVGDAAFHVGDGWNAGVTINITNGGRIEGHGGSGGSASLTGPVSNVGNPGGTAFYTRQAINLTNNAQIWGGGGGGGGNYLAPAYAAGGGGGAGTNGGDGGAASGGTSSPVPGQNGSADAGGRGGYNYSGSNNPTFRAGDGGGPGQTGGSAVNSAFPSQAKAGGAAGNAVDGNSFITYGATGDRQGGII